MKKLVSLVIVMALVLSLAVGAGAQEKAASGTDGATITITNAAKGETYTVYKVFDATVNTAGTSIAYTCTGDIPSDLTSVFEKDTANNVTVKTGVNDEAVMTALKTWAASATKVVSEVSDGSQLKFTNLDYGYYVVTSTQNQGSAITVTSTKPTASIVDKNVTAPGANLTKTVNDNNVKIGDTITYTVQFKTANYEAVTSKDAQNNDVVTQNQILSYTITDTLPDFLSNATITSVIVDNDGNTNTTDDQTSISSPAFTDKSYTIDWATGFAGNYTSSYKNGATVIITYTATVTDKVVIAGAGNTNTVTLSWNYTDNTVSSTAKPTASATIYSYAIALLKVDQGGTALANATFKLPFYVKKTADTDGAYIYAGTANGTDLIDTLTTPESGLIIIKGLEADSKISITETAAPAGYNLLTAPVEITPATNTTSETTIKIYKDTEGNVSETEVTGGSSSETNISIGATAKVVVNQTGTELPSTGGVGTTIFYALGSLMFVGALVLLVTNKRMKAE